MIDIACVIQRDIKLFGFHSVIIEIIYKLF